MDGHRSITFEKDWRSSQWLEKCICPTHPQERQEGESGELYAIKPHIRPPKIRKQVSHKVIFQAHEGQESDLEQPSLI